MLSVWSRYVWCIILILSLANAAMAQKALNGSRTKTESDTTQNRIVTVNRILIIGNKITREQIISRELSLKTGDTVSTRRLNTLLELDKQKIYNLRLFNTVEISWLEITPNTADLLVEVTERWYTFPVPIFELSDRNFNEWWQNYNHDLSRVNYGIRLYQYNFRGRNETLRFTAQFGFTRRFELSYRIPYIDKRQRHGLIFDFNYGEPKNIAYFTQDHKLTFLEEEKTLEYMHGARVSYTFRRNFYETHSLSIGLQKNNIIDTIGYLNPNYFIDGSTNQQYANITYSFNSEHRDVIAYPLKGYRFTAFINRIGIIPDSNVNLWEFNLTYSKYIDLGNNYFFSNFTALYLSTPNEQPYSLYSALGYRRQWVKGYEIYVVEGPKFFLNKTTLRKKIFSRTWQLENMPFEQFQYLPLAIYLKGYFDWGYVENYPYYEQQQINTRLSNRLLAGTGAGLDIVTAYDAVFRLEYTFTREKTNGFFFHIKKEF
ncbi:MAG: hypothetical protein MUF39_01650 [Cyclobacteriaceae bacterium]|nr:hypothetical protein [Cyclobacteriaceae bacterium]